MGVALNVTYPSPGTTSWHNWSSNTDLQIINKTLHAAETATRDFYFKEMYCHTFLLSHDQVVLDIGRDVVDESTLANLVNIEAEYPAQADHEEIA